jgi:hypothetical protein
MLLFQYKVIMFPKIKKKTGKTKQVSAHDQSDRLFSQSIRYFLIARLNLTCDQSAAGFVRGYPYFTQPPAIPDGKLHNNAVILSER